jgi:hypothetical protein
MNSDIAQHSALRGNAKVITYELGEKFQDSLGRSKTVAIQG